ncbi:archaellum component FlaF (FlaF/FlaG flagellin family) [Scopulibacillus daqui]|uniref:Archaellum component FlaF (FlaF/FlaG flagellin family) n=1 Tax=Scopulibacillus daqui TaxID=1469162 RepID=A0ABS2PVI2_9BACL|nr:hypothetical protein [Scopulibacillus daqui]MBM7644064.1 archaellum component FlaF (FlaF/FlaG flagellin family) [Scopulibacillus daqui]
MKIKKKLWITIGIVVLAFIILIAGVYLKHKQGEREIADRAAKKVKVFFKEKRNLDVVITDYEVSPMGGMDLFGHVKGDKKRNIDALVDITDNGKIITISSYGLDPKKDDND